MVDKYKERSIWFRAEVSCPDCLGLYDLSDHKMNERRKTVEPRDR